MRQLASFLLVALALPVAAAETWRWKDESGAVHYSDRPVPGAVRIDVGPAAGSGSSTVTITPPAPSPQPAEQPATKFHYSECIVLAPGNDQVFNAVNSVTASVQISPALQPDHRVQVILDGAVYANWPGRMLTYRLADIFRGTHTLAVMVLDADKTPLCTGPAISFHVRQPSILSPARKPAPKQP